MKSHYHNNSWRTVSYIPGDYPCTSDKQLCFVMQTQACKNANSFTRLRTRMTLLRLNIRTLTD
jgi:hypothetical protein